MSSKPKTPKTDDAASTPVTALARATNYSQAELLALGEIDNDALLESGKVEDAFMSLEKFKEIAKRSGLVARKIGRLKAGESVVGIYVGPGPTIQMSPDRKTGEVRSIRTHGLQVADQVILDLIGSFQLDREFSVTSVGDTCMIAHMGQVETKSNQRVNDYQFMRSGKSIAALIEEGRARQASAFLAADTIDASANESQSHADRPALSRRPD